MYPYCCLKKIMYCNSVCRSLADLRPPLTSSVWTGTTGTRAQSCGAAHPGRLRALLKLGFAPFCMRLGFPSSVVKVARGLKSVESTYNHRQSIRLVLGHQVMVGGIACVLTLWWGGLRVYSRGRSGGRRGCAVFVDAKSVREMPGNQVGVGIASLLTWPIRGPRPGVIARSKVTWWATLRVPASVWSRLAWRPRA